MNKCSFCNRYYPINLATTYESKFFCSSECDNEFFGEVNMPDFDLFKVSENLLEYLIIDCTSSDCTFCIKVRNHLSVRKFNDKLNGIIYD